MPSTSSSLRRSWTGSRRRSAKIPPFKGREPAVRSLGRAGVFLSAFSFSDPEIRKKLEEIFRDPAYGGAPWSVAPPSSAVSFLKTAARKLTEWLNSISGFFDNLHWESPVLFWLLLGALVLVLVLLLSHMGWTVVRTLKESARRTKDEDASPPEGKREVRRLLKESAALAARARYSEALRNLFLALLRALSETRYAAAPAGWTNHEIINALEAPPEIRDRLHRVAEAFDHGWYGRKRLAAEIYSSCRETVLEFMRTVEKKKRAGRSPQSRPVAGERNQ